MEIMGGINMVINGNNDIDKIEHAFYTCSCQEHIEVIQNGRNTQQLL